MAFNLFKKKEKINEISKNKGNNDIVEDYGDFVNSKNSGENENVSFSSFESNYNESIGNEPESMKISSVNDLVNIGDSFNHISSELPVSNIYNDFNIPIKEDTINNSVKSEEKENSNIKKTIPSGLNNVLEANNILQNINNYEYNPVMDNITNAQNNIKNSLDINAAFSSLYKSNTTKEENTNSETNSKNNLEQLIEKSRAKRNLSTVVEERFEQTPIKEEEEEEPEDLDVDPGYKRCPQCGQKIREDYKQCFICGKMF